MQSINISKIKNIFFTSDTHFSHENILKYCNRPFLTIDEHDAALIEKWNSKVSKNDTVYHLGDFGFKNTKKIIDILNHLNGKIHLIVGNHDSHILNSELINKFEFVKEQELIKINGQKIYMNHYPFLCYGGTYSGNPTWQLFGHVHSGPNVPENADMYRLNWLFPTQYDVGVDNNNYEPISFSELKMKIEQQIKNSKKNEQIY